MLPTGLETSRADAHTLFKVILNNEGSGLNTLFAIVMSLQLAGIPAEADPIDAFYAARGGALVWTGEENTTNRDALIEALASASDHGLDPDDYGYDALAGMPAS